MTSNLNINISLPAESLGRASQEAPPRPIDLVQGQAGVSYAAGAPAPIEPSAIAALAGGGVTGVAGFQPPPPADPRAIAAMAGSAAAGTPGLEPPIPMDLNQLAAVSGVRVGPSGGPPPPSRIEDVAAAAGRPVNVGLPPDPIPPEELREASSEDDDAGEGRGNPRRRRPQR